MCYNKLEKAKLEKNLAKPAIENVQTLLKKGVGKKNQKINKTLIFELANMALDYERAISYGKQKNCFIHILIMAKEGVLIISNLENN